MPDEQEQDGGRAQNIRDRFRRQTPKPRWNGYGQVPRWITASGLLAKLSGAAKGILIVMSFHANEEGEAWPSIRTMCAETGVIRKTALHALRELRAAGILVPEGRRLKVRTMMYRVPKDAPDTLRALGEIRAEKPPLSADEIGAEKRPLSSGGRVGDRGRKRALSSGPKMGPYPRKIGAEKRPANRHLEARKDTKGKKAAAQPTRALQTSPSSTPGKNQSTSDSLPEGFKGWVGHLNEGLALRPPKGYLATSRTGKRLAAMYGKALGEGHTQADLLQAIDTAMAKASRGFRVAAFPNWILGSGLEELVAEATAHPTGAGRVSAGRVFRTGEDHEKQLEAMRKVVER